MSENEATLRSLTAWVDQSRSWLLETAANAALGGDASWDAALSQMGIPPLAPDERRRHVAEGPKRSRGALPVELRQALVAVEERARAALRPLDRAASSPAEEALVRALEQRLLELVEGTMKEMLARTTPPANTSASIFANARASTQTYAASGAKAGATQMKCTTCGAPRKPGAGAAPVNDGAVIEPCAYCGGKVV